MDQDALIIRDYREAFGKYARNGIIDLDNKMKSSFSFQIHRLDTIVKGLNGIVPPSRQSQYFINLIKKGSGEKSIGHFTFPIRKNLLMVVPKSATQSSRYWSLDCKGYVLSFNLDFFLQNSFPKHHIVNNIIFKSSTRPFLILKNDQVKKLELLFEYILGEHKGKLTGKSVMIAVKILELIIQSDRLFSEAQSQQKEQIYNPLVERFIELIEKHYSNQRSVSFYANSLHTHPYHLNFLVKQYTGFTAKESIMNHIVLEAKVLLASTPLTIKEVSFKLGFDYSEHFSCIFKKVEKISPTQYRLKLL
jgi:AraC family transcriptional regulator, transcriptional activator of pobA